MSVELSRGIEVDPHGKKYLVEKKTESVSLLEEDEKSLKYKPASHRISLLQIVSRSRITIRVLAVMASLVSFVLIKYSVVFFENAQKAGSVKDSTGGKPQVDVKPAVTFSGIGGASFFLSLLLVFACCGSKKVRC